VEEAMRKMEYRLMGKLDLMGRGSGRSMTNRIDVDGVEINRTVRVWTGEEMANMEWEVEEARRKEKEMEREIEKGRGYGVRNKVTQAKRMELKGKKEKEKGKVKDVEMEKKKEKERVERNN
jgi:hypothetical protein